MWDFYVDSGWRLIVLYHVRPSVRAPPIVGRHGIILCDIGCGAVAAAINGRVLSNGVELRRNRRLQRGSDKALVDLWIHPIAG